MNKFEIHIATYSDCKKLAVLKREVWETTYRGIYPDNKINYYNFVRNEKKFKNIIANPDQQLYVAIYNQELIGYVEFGKPIRPFRDYTQEIGLLYLKKEYQRHGIGRELFHLAFTHIQNSGSNKFFISCHKYNQNAQKFYEKMGGKIVEIDSDSANNNLPQIKFAYSIYK